MSHRTLLHRIVRPGVKLVAGTGVTPNQVTTLRLLTGLMAAVAFAQGVQPWPALGAGVLVASMLLDRADGELARQTGKFSRLGYRYDLISDGVSTMAVFIGMGLGAQAQFGALAWVCGVASALGVLTLFILMRAFEPGEGSGTETRLVDPDDALLTVPVLVWSGLMGWTVLVAAAVTPIVSIVLAIIILQRRAASRFTRAEVPQGAEPR